MKRLLVLACLIAACGGPRSKPDPKSTPTADAGTDAPAVADCPDHIDCMPPTEGACPPPGLHERCPQTMITY
jgi:hypothetical protein